MKKLLIVACIMILCLGTIGFVGCNQTPQNEDNVVVTVTIFDSRPYAIFGDDYVKQNPVINYPDVLVTTHKYTIKKGEKFTAQYYYYELDGWGRGRGFYTDLECRIKYDEDTPVMQNLQLYMDARPHDIGAENVDYCDIIFVYQGETYSIFRRLHQTLTADDFAISAYGKPIETENLKFYRDENCEEEIVLDGMTQIIAYENWAHLPCFMYIYVVDQSAE